MRFKSWTHLDTWFSAMLSPASGLPQVIEPHGNIEAILSRVCLVLAPSLWFESWVSATQQSNWQNLRCDYGLGSVFLRQSQIISSGKLICLRKDLAISFKALHCNASFYNTVLTWWCTWWWGIKCVPWIISSFWALHLMA